MKQPNDDENLFLNGEKRKWVDTIEDPQQLFLFAIGPSTFLGSHYHDHIRYVLCDKKNKKIKKGKK